MTPYQIGILIWYHASRDDHPDIHRKPPIWQETIDGFITDGLIQAGAPATYAPTPRLHAYVNALCSVPLPRSAWVTDWHLVQQ